MNQKIALKVLTHLDQEGRFVFTLGDLKKCFLQDNQKTLQEGVNRLVRQGLLTRACRGIYVFNLMRNNDGYLIEHVAKALRRGKYSYVSLESALSEYGAISQIPIDRITIMTTGREGEYRTPYGVIEFTHSKRSVQDLLSGVKDIKRPLRFATPETAWRDLKRVGRNVHLVDEEALKND